MTNNNNERIGVHFNFKKEVDKLRIVKGELFNDLAALDYAEKLLNEVIETLTRPTVELRTREDN
jgi:hypothetical protein|tara:strand:+ start:1720 stop:1911 length:192 start_codon:yes stop_codon:yes gene_type:complete